MAKVMELLSAGVGSSVTLASFEFGPGAEARPSGPKACALSTLVTSCSHSGARQPEFESGLHIYQLYNSEQVTDSSVSEFPHLKNEDNNSYLPHSIVELITS